MARKRRVGQEEVILEENQHDNGTGRRDQKEISEERIVGKSPSDLLYGDGS